MNLAGRTICGGLLWGLLHGMLHGGALGQAPGGPAAAALGLEEVIRRAEANEPGFVAAAAEKQATALERRDAKAALLPSATYHNQYLFTQSNRTTATTTQGGINQALPVFIANNAVHEYYSQGVVDEKVGLAQIAAVHLASANAARAEAEAEIARRGLVQAVVGLFYNIVAGTEKIRVAQEALDEAGRFLDVTTKREQGREAAHSDVIKARLSEQQRERELDEAKLTEARTRLELGVLLFADPMTAYTLAAPTARPELPDRATVDAAAKGNNPEIRSAMASLQASEATHLGAEAALLPDLVLNFTYGIDAPQFARYGPDGARNLGYSASATLDLPVWDWLTSERKVKEAKIRSQAARTALSAAQRRLLADLSAFYQEAEVARRQLTSLDASVADARESLRLTNLRYVNGEGTVLDVVDAQNTLVAAENAQADGEVRYQSALAQLGTLTGKL